MGLTELTYASVVKAIEEFDRLGRAAFLDTHGYAEARNYYVQYEGNLYDSKAIAGVAHGYARPDLGPLNAEEFSGGAATVETRLTELGFEMIRLEPTWDLSPGDTIKRTELHSQYGGSGQGGISPSRKSTNILVFTDRSVGDQHGYHDRWEGTTLHYTGEGQHGHQQMIKGNRAIRHHIDDGRSLRVFEGTSSEVSYVGEFALDGSQPWYTNRARETGGGPYRDVIMFRLVPIGEIKSEGRTISSKTEISSLTSVYIPADEEAASQQADVIEIDPDIIDRGRRGHARTQNIVSEWAKSQGFQPIRPVAGDPAFDVGWWDGDVFNVVEVKSLTEKNEVTQLRLGLGQVLDYSSQLNRAGVTAVPLLAVERKPTDARWVNVCDDYGVRLVWPEVLGRSGPTISS